MDTLIPKGRYRMAYLSHEEGNAYGRGIWFVRFQITEPNEYHGFIILRFYNVPKGSRIARSSGIAIDFMNLTGLRPPASLTPDYFLKECEVLARVVTVKDRVDAKGRTRLPQGLHYSKVDQLLEITAGSPPCLQGRDPDRRRSPTSPSPRTRT